MQPNSSPKDTNQKDTSNRDEKEPPKDHDNDIVLPEHDHLDEALNESFPASDTPAPVTK